MGRVNITLLVVVTVAVVGMTVVPATAQVQSVDDSSSQQAAALEPKDDDDPWLANGTGGKENGGREDNENQQYPGETTFQIDNHAPGASSNSFNIYAVGFSENIRMHWNVVKQPAFDFSSCTSADARAFGIDRGNDQSGTQTDESLLDAYQSVTYAQDNIFVEFYKEDQLAGGPVNVTVNDQIVSRVANCLQNPQEPGWYRLTGYINGSTKMDPQTDFTIYGASKYTYICQGCDSRQAAIDKLGPPPTTCPKTDEFSFDQKEWTCRTEGGEYYTNSDPPGDSGSQNTPTPTESQQGNGQQQPDQQQTQQQQTDQQTVQQTQQTQQTTQQTDSPTGTVTATTTGDDTTATGGDGTATGGDQQAGNGTTPTMGNGPGFGAVVSVLALLSAGLLAVRRGRRSG